MLKKAHLFLRFSKFYLVRFNFLSIVKMNYFIASSSLLYIYMLYVIDTYFIHAYRLLQIIDYYFFDNLKSF